MERLLTGILRQMYKAWRYAHTHPRLRKVLYRACNTDMFNDVSQHEDMLSDPVRISTYHAAIKKHVNEKDVVIDLGTGTGILAFFASQQHPKKIYAIDHSDTIELAKHLARSNGISNIEFCKFHSSKFGDDVKASVIIHEQIGGFLFDEDMVRNLAELRDKVLLPGGKILPNKFDLFFEPVQLNEERRTPFLWENDLYGIEFSSAQEWLKARNHKAEWPSIALKPGDVKSFNCKPESVLSFDLLTVGPDSLPTSLKFRKTAVRSGPMDGFCLYFKVGFDEEIGFETSPLAQPTHWASQLFRTERIYLNEGDVLDVEFHMGDPTNCRTWWFKHSLEARAMPPSLAAE